MDKRDLNKERLQLALDAAGLDLWENNLVSGEVTRKATKIFKELGYSDDESLAYLDDLFVIVHPDDVPVVKAALNAHLNGVTAQYRCEFRVRSKSGAWVWYANYGKIMDPEGDMQGRHFIGVTFNIDDRKRAEDRFRSIIEAVPIPLALNDAPGNITYLNRAFTQLLGYTTTDVPDLSSWWHLAYPDPQYRQWVTDIWQKKMDEAKRSGKPFDSMEFAITCKDGITRTFLISPVALDQELDGLELVALYDVTERNKMERVFRFRQIGLDRAGEGIIWVDQDGHILESNETACRKLGYTHEEMSRLTIADIDPCFSFETWPEHWQELKNNQVVRLESMQKCREGTTFPTEVTANFFEYEGKEYNCALVQDITDRKIAEARIKRLSNLYKALSEVNQAIVRMETEETLFPLVCKMAVDFGGFRMAWVGEHNAVTEQIEVKVSYGNGADYLKEVTISANESRVEGRGPSGTAFRKNRIITVNDFLSSDMTTHWHEAAARFGWQSSGVFPILRGEKPFAILTVYHDQKDAFDEETIELLTEMVRDVSFALDSFDREKSRRQALESLNASERHFRAYFERSMVGMAATSSTKGVLEVNDALCEMLGYSKDELMGMTWAELTHSDDLEVNENLFDRVLRGDLNEYELDKRFIRKGGEIVYVHIAVRAVRNEDEIVDYFVAIIDDVTDTRNKQRQLELLVHYDTLTGLPNRSLLNDRLEMGLAQVKRTVNLAVCFMDLDGFKPVNDTFGHEVGDAMLIEVAKRIVAISRATDTVARMGGDEFVLLFPEISGEEECRHMLSRIMEAISQPFNVNGHEIQISASIGIAIYPEDVNDGESLIRHADQAMYIAKQLGRNRMHFFDAANDQLAQIRSEGLSRVEMALECGELILYYQPKVNMRSGQVIGMEALIRWLHPQRGLLPPGEFMPLIENSDFEIRLSEWVISKAMTQLTAWRKEGIALTVSVNLPARHLQSHGFTEFIASAVAKHSDMEANSFELEILETAALGDMGAAIHKMQSCIEQGIHFSIDDFGTGYASLAYLRRLPAHMIKIDQIFVRDMLDDEDDLSIVEGVIGLAKAFKKDVIAEGVETVAHGVKLLNLGCELAQGYGIARPMEAKFVTDWVRNYHLPTDWSRCSE